MPELPEVETTVRSLKKEVLKRTFVDVWPDLPIKGRRIEEVSRRGKYILFTLDSGDVFFVHLRMTGHFLLGRWKLINGQWKSEEKIMQDKKNGYIRHIFLLDDGRQLALSDPRKFASLRFFKKQEAENYLSRLGPDILLLNKKDFVKMIISKKREIKPLLMDQHFISGIGNIYATEALFISKIYPGKRSDTVALKKVEDLYDALHRVLKRSIILKGDSTSDYRLISGKKGGYQKEHLVYRKKECSSCQKKITRVVLGGRGSYYCSSCQKK